MSSDGRKKWRCAGMLAKAAGKGSVVSNVQRGKGYTLTIEDALRKSLHLDRERIERTKKRLLRISRRIMRHSDSFPFYSYECGIDCREQKRADPRKADKAGDQPFKCARNEVTRVV